MKRIAALYGSGETIIHAPMRYLMATFDALKPPIKAFPVDPSKSGSDSI
jgi:hypothetical protein